LAKGLQCCALSHHGLDRTRAEQTAAVEEVEQLGVIMANFIKKLSRLFDLGLFLLPDIRPKLHRQQRLTAGEITV
jgi:hypothetical protein